MRVLPILAVIAGIILAGCQQSPPKVSVNVDSLGTVYAELLVLNERYSLSKDSLSAQQYDSAYTDVLQKNQYTKDRFSRELETVSKSPDAFRQLCERVLAQFRVMRQMPAQTRNHP